MTKAPAWIWTLYIAVLAVFYLPVIEMARGAFIDEQKAVSLFWFNEVLSDHRLLSALGTSLTVAISASFISCLLGTAAAISLAKAEGRLKNYFQTLTMIAVFLPEIIMALSLLSLFFVLKFSLGYFTLIIAHVTLTLSFVILTVSSKLNVLDPSYSEAAMDLGCSSWQVFRFITWPLIRPAVIGGFLLSFLISFDDFLLSFFVNGVGMDTLPVQLYSSMKLGLSPKLNALSVMMLALGLLLIFLLFRVSRFHALLNRNEK